MAIDSLAAGGAERVVLNLSRTLVRLGHKVTILNIQNEIEYTIDFPVEIETINFKKERGHANYRKFSSRLRKLVQKHESHSGPFDLVISHLQISHRLVSKARIPGVFFCIHSAISPGSLGNRKGLRRYFKQLKIKSYLDGKDIIAIAEGMAADLTENVKVKPATLRVIPNAIDFEQINTLANETNPYQNESYIIHVARFTGFKRHDRLLRAFRTADIQQRLLLLGDGELRPQIEADVEKLGLSDKVKFCGFQQNPYPILRDAQLCVLSSDYEGLPTVLIEALSLGVPVVSTDCPSGPREILQGPLRKYLTPVQDTDALSEMLQTALNDAGSGAYPFESARLDRFEPETIARAYLELANRRSNPA